MAITKNKKKEIVEKLTKIGKEALALAFVNFHGLSVANATEMRRGLRGAGIGYFVAKKSLIRRALGGLGIAGTIPEFPGEIGVAYGNDPVAPAREVYTFEKKFEKKIALVGGVFEGAFIDKEKVLTIALIPPLKTLQAQFVNLINSPIQRFAVVLDAITGAKAQ